MRPNIKFKLGSYGHLYSRILDIKNHKNVDILFLGSSHAYRGFDTRIFSKKGYKAFNLGSSSQTPLQTRVLLNRYLKDLNPRLVVYEVYPGTFISDGVESSLDIIANDTNDFYSFDMVLEVKNIKTFNTFLYSSMRDLFNLNKTYKESTEKGIDIYIPGGYVKREISYYKPNNFAKKEIKIKDYQLEAFAEIIEKLRKNGIEVILVNAPISNSKYESFTNTKYFDSIMNQYSNYFNFNEIMSLNDSLHFYDSHHLNQHGVELFNKKLIRILDSEYFSKHDFNLDTIQ